MVDIARHQILQQAVEVFYAIEKCGASPELTDAVTLASAIVQSIDKLLDEHNIAIKKDPSGGHATHTWYDSASLGGKVCHNCGVPAGTNRAQKECK